MRVWCSPQKLKGLFTAPKPKPTSEEPVASASQEMSIEDKQNAAAVKVQASFRGFQARKEVEALKMETASPDFLKGKKRFLFGAVVVAGLVAKILSARKPPPKPEPQYSTFCLGEKAAKKAGLPGCVCLRVSHPCVRLRAPSLFPLLLFS